MSDVLRWLLGHPIETMVAAEVGVFAVIAVLNVREYRFIRTLRSLKELDEDLPLLDALLGRAGFMAASGAYLIALTVLASLGFVLATAFPLIRPLNGLIFLAMFAGPVFVGRALRRSPRVKRAAGIDGEAANG